MIIDFFLMFNWVDYVLLAIVIILVVGYIISLINEYNCAEQMRIKPRRRSDAYISTLPYTDGSEK